MWMQTNTCVTTWKQKYAINQVGYSYAFVRESESTPRSSPSVQVMLDYRCHVPSEGIGYNYPPQVKKCLTRISNMSIDAIEREYQLPDHTGAEVLCTSTICQNEHKGS